MDHRENVGLDLQAIRNFSFLRDSSRIQHKDKKDLRGDCLKGKSFFEAIA
jgi:hypothetical protein